MSRIGKQPVKVPAGVTVTFKDGILDVKGPKGQLKRDTLNRVTLTQDKDIITLAPAAGSDTNQYWGLYRTLLSNMIEGVTSGFTKQLEVVGTGYRASMTGKNLTLAVGYSHPVNMEPAPGIVFDVDKAGKIVVQGADKELVGQTAATIRSVRAPEPYKGKGVRYVGEKVVQKVGKSTGKK